MSSIALNGNKKRVGLPSIYVFKDIGNKAIKVGFSIDYDSRKKRHNTSNPFLKLVALLPVTAQSVEFELHKILTPYRLPDCVEWYADSYKLRYTLHRFFADEGVLTKPNWDIFSKYPPDSKELDCFYVNLPDVYSRQLIIIAWLSGKSGSEQIADFLFGTIEESIGKYDYVLSGVARQMGITTDQLTSGILDGTIAPDTFTIAASMQAPEPSIAPSIAGSGAPDWDDY